MKTIFITGSTDGIGKLTAIKLAKDGHQIIVHGRNSEKLKNVISEIKNNTGNENISGFISDLSDFKSIENMVTELSKKNSKIDVLINNAGVFKSNAQFNKVNLDLRFTVNYLAPYLVTNGLLPILNNSNSPRVINLSSAAQSTVSLEVLRGEKTISSQEAYSQSKLALTMWSFYLSKQHDTVSVIAVNPGSLLNTKMVKEAYGQYWSPADKGVDVLYELALSEKYIDSNGKYFDNDKGFFSYAHDDAYEQEKINDLIYETNKIVKKMTNNSALTQARSLVLPSREALLKRDVSVSSFWKSNRELLEKAWSEWEINNKESLPIPNETLLSPVLRKAIKEAWENPEKENAVADLWEEIIPGVYVAQFFDPERLVEFRNYLEAVVNSQIPKRAPYGIQLNRHGIMLDPRSEGFLAAPNFQAFYKDIMNLYMRPIARLLLGTYGYDNQTFGFSIQYNPDKDKNLQSHTDASTVTLNININLPDEKFTGSQVDFYDRSTGKTVQTAFEPGKAIIHRGNVPHATHSIISGQRSNLVVWLYGDGMQVPPGSRIGYGNLSNSSSTIDTTKKITARERWSVPKETKDMSAPF